MAAEFEGILISRKCAEASDAMLAVVLFCCVVLLLICLDVLICA
jgi:hypothetical protein